MSVLDAILARKEREVARRRRHGKHRLRPPVLPPRRLLDPEALRRDSDGRLSVLAEVKFRSPSAGRIRAWSAGEGVRVARQYAGAGATAISVLADGPGFGGSVLQVRRVAEAVDVPVLFKEFVLDEVQLDAARATGAALVLLLVRALPPSTLRTMCGAAEARGLLPLVEAADRREVDVALEAGARVIGVNARDLCTFRVDLARASSALEAIPTDRVALHLSGVGTRDDLSRVADGRADGVLIGSGLMRADSPGRRLRELLEERG